MLVPRQANSIDGTISVTVVRVYPNGNLEIKGERKLSYNSGNEFIRLSGVVRPEDISSSNEVSSTKVADAQIVDDAQEVYIVSENAQIIRIDLKEIKRVKGRISQGVQIFVPKPGDSVSSLYCAKEFEIEEESDTEEVKSKKKSDNKAKGKK